MILQQLHSHWFSDRWWSESTTRALRTWPRHAARKLQTVIDEELGSIRRVWLNAGRTNSWLKLIQSLLNKSLVYGDMSRFYLGEWICKYKITVAPGRIWQQLYTQNICDFFLLKSPKYDYVHCPLLLYVISFQTGSAKSPCSPCEFY